MAERQAGQIAVQVCYATPQRQFFREVEVADGTTLVQAITCSGVLDQEPQLNLADCRFGIFGKVRAPDTVLRHGDRVEIYRPLLADPKETRRRRALKR